MEAVSDLDLSEHAEELLESLWTHKEKDGNPWVLLERVGIERESEALRELVHFTLVTLSDNQISLTRQGTVEAEKVIRRHRLAERLLVDVLGVEDVLLEESACKFEHVIREGIEENVCVLLGHPRVCPHGNPIPRGQCCIHGEEQTTRVVSSLAQLDADSEGRIAYLHATDGKRLQKLITMGVTPGKQIRVIQRFPTYVFQIGQTQIAVDQEIAEEIYVLQTTPR